MFISTKIGTAPTLLIADTVGIAVFETVITSSPFLTPMAFKAIIKASVPLETPTEYFVPIYFLLWSSYNN